MSSEAAEKAWRDRISSANSMDERDKQLWCGGYDAAQAESRERIAEGRENIAKRIAELVCELGEIKTERDGLRESLRWALQYVPPILDCSANDPLEEMVRKSKQFADDLKLAKARAAGTTGQEEG